MHPVLLSLLLSLLLLLSACAEPEVPAPQPRTVLVQVVPDERDAQPGDVEVYAGEVRARYEHEQGFRIGGKLVERRVDVGASVARGDVLARLDPEDVRLQANAARAQVSAAAAEVELARAELVRSEDLHQRNYISESALDARRTALQAAEAALRQARAQAEVADNQSAYAELRAEQAGIVVAVSAEAGQVVAAGQTVVRIVQPEAREVLFHLPESRMRNYTVGQAAQVKVLGEDGLRPALIREIAPVADVATRSYAVRVSLLPPDEADATLAPAPLGATANVLFARKRSGGIELPLSALTAIESRPTVWVVGEGERLASRSVLIGAMRERGVEVVQGVQAGERVVVAGVHLLIEGEQVRVREVGAPVALDVSR